MNAIRVAALQAMAQAEESPFERDIARTKLAEAGIPIEPPRPPAPPAASPSPQEWWFGGGTSTTTNGGWSNTNSTINFTINFAGVVW